jgi:hypothetical protein
MLVNIYKVMLSILRFFKHAESSQEYQNLEFSKKFFPTDFEELKKLKIDQI